MLSKYNYLDPICGYNKRPLVVEIDDFNLNEMRIKENIIFEKKMLLLYFGNRSQE